LGHDAGKRIDRRGAAHRANAATRRYAARGLVSLHPGSGPAAPRSVLLEAR